MKPRLSHLSLEETFSAIQQLKERQCCFECGKNGPMALIIVYRDAEEADQRFFCSPACFSANLRRS
jgi:hypothetical protein